MSRFQQRVSSRCPIQQQVRLIFQVQMIEKWIAVVKRERNSYLAAEGAAVCSPLSDFELFDGFSLS